MGRADTAKTRVCYGGCGSSGVLIMKQTGQFLIYGATGFTGKLTARTATDRGLKPILAGRNEAKLRAVALPLGLQYRVFELSDAAAIDAALGQVDAVLHIAGPFSATSKPMADACLRTGTHYLDITGEIDVFEALAQRDAEAKEGGHHAAAGRRLRRGAIRLPGFASEAKTAGRRGFEDLYRRLECGYRAERQNR